MKRGTLGLFGLLACFGLAGAVRANDSPEHILDKHRDAVVRIYVNGAFRGCGFVVSRDGLVITARHVISAKDPASVLGIEVEQRKGSGPYHTYPAVWRDSSIPADMVLLRTIAIGISPVPLAKATAARLGTQSTVVTALKGANAPAVMSGPITDSRRVSVNQLNAWVVVSQIANGEASSGAPLFNEDGRVIGVVDRLAGSSSESNEEVSAIDISYAEPMIKKELQLSRPAGDSPSILEFPFPSTPLITHSSAMP